jgi:sporulation protein YlmC with PRC-barrel domain
MQKFSTTGFVAISFASIAIASLAPASAAATCTDQMKTVKAVWDLAPDGAKKDAALIHYQDAENSQKSVNEEACLAHLTLATAALENQLATSPESEMAQGNIVTPSVSETSTLATDEMDAVQNDPVSTISLLPEQSRLALSSAQSMELNRGWSVQRSLMGKAIYGEDNAVIGAVDDIIISADGGENFLLVKYGGYYGFGEHTVAVSLRALSLVNDKLRLEGATKEVLKSLSEYEPQTQN